MHGRSVAPGKAFILGGWCSPAGIEGFSGRANSFAFAGGFATLTECSDCTGCFVTPVGCLDPASCLAELIDWLDSTGCFTAWVDGFSGSGWFDAGLGCFDRSGWLSSLGLFRFLFSWAHTGFAPLRRSNSRLTISLRTKTDIPPITDGMKNL